jgi:hypothetical protein
MSRLVLIVVAIQFLCACSGGSGSSSPRPPAADDKPLGSFSVTNPDASRDRIYPSCENTKIAWNPNFHVGSEIVRRSDASLIGKPATETLATTLHMKIDAIAPDSLLFTLSAPDTAPGFWIKEKCVLKSDSSDPVDCQQTSSGTMPPTGGVLQEKDCYVDISDSDSTTPPQKYEAGNFTLAEGHSTFSAYRITSQEKGHIVCDGKDDKKIDAGHGTVDDIRIVSSEAPTELVVACPSPVPVFEYQIGKSDSGEIIFINRTETLSIK